MTLKRNILFRIIAGVMVAFAVLGIKDNISSIQYYQLLELSMLFPIVSLIACVVELIAGFIGILAKKKTTIIVLGVLTLIVVAVDVIIGLKLEDQLSAVMESTSTVFLSLIFPVVYLIGAFCCKQE